MLTRIATLFAFFVAPASSSSDRKSTNFGGRTPRLEPRTADRRFAREP